MPTVENQQPNADDGFFRCSLVIATLHDDGELQQCLSSLSKLQDTSCVEVIIVDQNEDDRLLEIVSGFSAQLDIVHERVAFRGANRARNIGAHLATGNWLGFPDDDCQLFPDALLQVVKIAADPRVQIITGQTVDEQGQPNVLRWKQQTQQFDRWSMFSCVTEATLFVRREQFLAVGGFDPRFGPGATYPAAEGIDLVNRLLASMGDGKAWYSPLIKMQHPSKIPPWNRWAVGRFHSYAIGDGALIAKNPQAHMLNWGMRTLASAFLQMFSLQGWRGVAFAARIVGLLKGFVSFHLAAWRE